MHLHDAPFTLLLKVASFSQSQLTKLPLNLICKRVFVSTEFLFSIFPIANICYYALCILVPFSVLATHAEDSLTTTLVVIITRI